MDNITGELIEFDNDYGAYGTVSVKTRPYRDLTRWDLPKDELFELIGGSATYSNGLISMVRSTSTSGYAYYKYGLTQFKPNTTYTACINVISNTLTGGGMYFNATSTTGQVPIVPRDMSIPVGFIGQLKYTFTTKSDISNAVCINRSYLSSGSTGSITYYFSIYEGDYTTETFPDDLGYNAFDINKVVTRVLDDNNYVRNNGDSTLSVKVRDSYSPYIPGSIASTNPNLLRSLIGDIPMGTNVTLTFDTTGSAKYVSLVNAGIKWYSGQTLPLTTTMLNSTVAWCADTIDSTTVVTLSNIKFTVGGGFEVIHSGKNLLPPKTDDKFYSGNGTYTIPVKEGETNQYVTIGVFKAKANVTYTFGCNVATTVGSTLGEYTPGLMRLRDENGSAVSDLRYDDKTRYQEFILSKDTEVTVVIYGRGSTGATSPYTLKFSNLFINIGKNATLYEPYVGETLYVPMNTGYRFPLWKGTNQLLSTQDKVPLTVTTGGYIPRKQWYASDYINIEDYYRITTNLGYVGNMAKEKGYDSVVVSDKPLTLQTSGIATTDSWNRVENDLDDLSRKIGYNGKVKQVFTVRSPYIDHNELNAIENSIEFYYNKVKEE